MAASSFDPKGTAQAQLRFFIENLDPKQQALFRSVRAAVRKRLPTANELVYDYYTFLVIGYSPNEVPTDGIVSIAARPDGVRLYLMHGPLLRDPKKLLLGSGKQTRYVQVEAASRLAHPDVEALIAGAIELAEVPLPSTGRGKLIIRSVSAKRQPRGKRAK